MVEEVEWQIKIWKLVGDMSIFHARKFCNYENQKVKDFHGYTYVSIPIGVCYTCEKPFPDHIKLQWQLGGWHNGHI